MLGARWDSQGPRGSAKFCSISQKGRGGRCPNGFRLIKARQIIFQPLRRAAGTRGPHARLLGSTNCGLVFQGNGSFYHRKHRQPTIPPTRELEKKKKAFDPFTSIHRIVEFLPHFVIKTICSLKPWGGGPLLRIGGGGTSFVNIQIKSQRGARSWLHRTTYPRSPFAVKSAAIRRIFQLTGKQAPQTPSP